MGYTESLLADGERIVVRERRHWLAVPIDSRWAILGLVIAFVLYLINLDGTVSGPKGTIGMLLGWVILVLVVGGLAWLAWTVWNWYNEDYLITNRRVVKVEGVINKHTADSSLEKINDAQLDQHFIGRMLGFGDLDILTAAEVEVDRFRMLNHVVNFKRQMLNQKHELEFEQMRPPAGPPLRAPGMAPVAPPPGPANPTMTVTGDMVPAGGVAGPGWTPGSTSNPDAPTLPRPPKTESRMSPNEVTQTLANLADLRDRGAITPEEFDVKKAELLRLL